jgi:ceramide glucosyltransferase
MTSLTLVLDVQLAAAGLYGAVCLARVHAALRYLGEAPEARSGWAPATPGTLSGALPGAPPRLTLLQPILGGDPALGGVLRESLTRTPPWVVFQWLVDTDDAVGRAVVDELLAALPAGDVARVAVVLCPPAARTENPKSAKLALALPRVTTDFCGVLDDDTVVGESNVLAALDVLGARDGAPRAELYTGLPSYDAGMNVPSALLAQFVNDNAPSTYLALQRRFGALSINGMFYVAGTAFLRRINAFESIRGELCDDYALAKLVRGAGGRIRQGTTALRLTTSLESGVAYVRQMHRWFVFALVLLRDQPLPRRAALAVVLSIAPAALAIVTVGGALGARGLATLLAVLALRAMAQAKLQRAAFTTRPGPRPRSAPLLSVVAELAQPLHALHAVCVKTIRWRSRVIRVARGGRYEEVAPRC